MANDMMQNQRFEESIAYEGVPMAPDVMPTSLLQILWRSRWIILMSTVITIGATIAYLVVTPPIYSSTSKIYVEQSAPKIVAETSDSVMTQSDNYLGTQKEMLKSTPILTAALNTPGENIAQMKVFEKVENPITFLKKKGLDVSVSKSNDIISVTSESPRPVEAARLVNAVVDAYVTYHETSKRNTSTEILKVLQNEKSKRSLELRQQHEAMMAFRQQSDAPTFEDDRGNITVQKLERLSTLLTEAQLRTADSRTRYEFTQKMIADPVGLRQFVEANGFASKPDTRDSEREYYRTELQQLRRRRSDLQQQVTGAHPLMIAITEQITHIREKMTGLDREFARNQLVVAEQQYLAAKEMEKELARQLQAQRQQTLQYNSQLARYQTLRSEWEQTRKHLEVLNERIKEVDLTEDVGALYIKVLEVARAADKPLKPQKERCIAVALVLGLMLGGGLSLERHRKDQRLHSVEEISAILDLPILGTIPSMPKKETVEALGRKVHLEPTSAAAEAYKAVRTAMFFRAPQVKTVLVTSPGAGDGKSTLVSNLGIAMAQAGQRVVILDADLRKPRQQDVFEVERAPGLSSVLSGSVTLGEAIRPSSIDGLEILPCGPDVPNPSECLNGKGFAGIIAELSKTYDRIVVDAPPVLAVTDACILGALCDVTLLVIRDETSARKTAPQARDGLLSVGALLLGAIVNDVPAKKGGCRYYYHGERAAMSRHHAARDQQEATLTAVSAKQMTG